MVGYLLRYHAGLNRIKAAIDDRAMNIETLSYRRRTTRMKPSGADPLFTLAVHGLDTARYLTGGVWLRWRFESWRPRIPLPTFGFGIGLAHHD